MMEWILSACVLTAAVIGLRYALGGRIDPRLQYALWALVLVRLLIPVNFGWAPLLRGQRRPHPGRQHLCPGGFCRRGVSPSPAFRPPTQHRPPPPEAADPAPAPAPSPSALEGRTRAAHPLPEPRGSPCSGWWGWQRSPCGWPGPTSALPGSSGGPASRWRWRGPAAPSTSPRPWSPPVSSAWPVRHLPAPKDFGGPRGPALRRGP